MDMRSLDPFVLDPPGRVNNLYNTFGETMNHIDESPMVYAENPSATLCPVACSIGNNLCFQEHIQKEPITPPRFMQFDIKVEDEINKPPEMDEYPLFKQMKPSENWLFFWIGLIVILYFAQR